jgi:hypothetical protein
MPHPQHGPCVVPLVYLHCRNGIVIRAPRLRRLLFSSTRILAGVLRILREVTQPLWLGINIIAMDWARGALYPAVPQGKVWTVNVMDLHI